MRPASVAGLIIGLFLILGAIYSLVTPVLEASDEFKHYPYVQYVQTQGKLPILEPDVCRDTADECPWLQDGAQPPAYYVLMAAATSWMDTSDLPTLLWRNKHAFIGNPTQLCNKNLIIHRPEQEQFPWRGSVLAVHVIRLLTVWLGAGTVFLTYRLARRLFPERPVLALGAAALTAFNPMFLFVSASVNNDALAALLGSWALLVIVRAAEGPSPTTRPKLTRQSIALGLVIGIGMLTKLSLLGLVPVAALVVSLRAWHSHADGSAGRRLVSVVRYPLLLVLAAASVSGWWFLRNWRLYGDPTALNAFIAVQGRRQEAPALQDWLGEFGTFRWTYWGLFGGVNVMAPQPFYLLCDLLSLVGLIGFALWLVRRWREGPVDSDRRVLIPVVWAGVLFVSVLRWTWIFPAFQGRLIFPGIAGISTLMMLGLRQWTTKRYRDLVSLSVGLALFIMATLLPFVAIQPAYAQPRPLTLSQVPRSARVDPVDVGGIARVAGIQFEPQTIEPESASGFVDTVIYWEAVRSPKTDYVSFARVLGRGQELAGHVNRHPACGMVPTSLWQPGQVWRDAYRVPIRDDAQAPSELRLEVGLYDPTADRTLGAVPVGVAKLAPPSCSPDVGRPLDVQLADGVTMHGYSLAPADVQAGDVLRATLYWKAWGSPSADYQVFVHLLGDDSVPIAQADGPPLMGDYPTSLWEAGEIIADPHSVDLPADLPEGHYRLLVGMYALETMKRLPRADGGPAGVEIPIALGVD